MPNLHIEYRPIESLVPYINNARTHSDEQVAQVAASIREFGFNNPILADGERGLIAGHGRLLAARKLGLDTVPVIELAHLPKSSRRMGVKDCLCSDCGTEFTVRKDTSPLVCRRCASARGGKSKKGVIRAKYNPCPCCERLFIASSGNKYCSKKCSHLAKITIRTCKFCTSTFEILQSAIRRTTNATGNFCSRPCYEKWLCRTTRVTGRGSQWKRARKISLKRIPFCALCGTQHRLQVHHIAPFHLSHNNSQINLIPLCTKHHKHVESITHDIEATHSPPDEITFVMGNILREYTMATASVIKELYNATRRTVGN